MKNLKQFGFLILLFLVSKNVVSQNVMINILTQNSGSIKKNEVVFLEVTINNTNSIKSVPVYKLRPQISFPSTLVNIPETGHILPKGWIITSNAKGVVWLSNGSDIIPANESRTILIAMKGKVIGGPSTILGNLSFSNGAAPGVLSGAPTTGDNPADNASSSTIMVLK